MCEICGVTLADSDKDGLCPDCRNSALEESAGNYERTINTEDQE